MNVAAGAVEVTSPYGKTRASGQKISRCHVITAAHVLYKDGRTSVDGFDGGSSIAPEEHNIIFRTGQTCNEQKFDKSSNATVRFRMTKPKLDFVCDRLDNNDRCLGRRFLGKSDLVILKLTEYDRKDTHFFGLETNSEINNREGDRINCWGYPGYNNQLSWIPKSLSDQFLWFQKSARIFPGNYDRGILTNAIAYPGMSGGGCARETMLSKIFAIMVAKNSLTGHPAILITENNADEMSANFLAPFDRLSQRFKEETGTDIERIDDECD